MTCGISNGHMTDDVAWPPKVLWGSTVGYPSDSLACCWLCDGGFQFRILVESQPTGAFQKFGVSVLPTIDFLLFLSSSSSLPFNSCRSTGRRRYSATPPDLVPCSLLRSSSVSCFPAPSQLSSTPLLHTRTQLLQSRVQLANKSRITWVLLYSLVRQIDVLLYHRCFRNPSFLRSRWLV